MLRPLLLKRSLRLHHHHYHHSSTQSHSHPLRTLTPPNPFLRRFSSLPEPNADAETRKYIGYAALLLFCGAATYYSFPLPENAKHKKAQIFRYAPLPEDLHTVSNWSGTHEVQTRNFHQPESIDELERV
ncbi:L-galactono-14-lactone dehydrogenase mitochondrial-like, partial [Trifolium medium]|nr:L-galactono-14-lactone dehydrogenase mitochondrial-like [Trifolium medium]